MRKRKNCCVVIAGMQFSCCTSIEYTILFRGKAGNYHDISWPGILYTKTQICGVSLAHLRDKAEAKVKMYNFNWHEFHSTINDITKKTYSMWYNTKASAMLGIEYPILLGPFGGGLSSVELVAAVSNAGGLGGYGAYTLSPQEIYEVDKQIKAATGKPFNINLWVSDMDTPDGNITDARFEEAKQLFKPYFDELDIPLPAKPPTFQSRFENQVQVILDIRPKAFSFMFGIPSTDILEQCRRSGIKTIGAATTLQEAIALEDAGVDMIIAAGFEAGGHRPSFLAPAELSTHGSFVLLQLMREKTNTPIIAAGGIADGRGVAAAMILGADAVQVGTAFFACDESAALPIHREMLFADAAKRTILTRAYTGRLGRGIMNRVTTELAGKEKQFLPFPLQTTFMSSLRKNALEQQKYDMVLFWGGQIAPILKHRKATALMKSLIEEAGEWL